MSTMGQPIAVLCSLRTLNIFSFSPKLRLVATIKVVPVRCYGNCFNSKIWCLDNIEGTRVVLVGTRASNGGVYLDALERPQEGT
jgi:hypothetical protein